MGDTDHLKKETRQIQIPSWAVETFKVGASVVIALALAFVRFSILENKVIDHQTAISSLVAKQENARDTAAMQAQKVSTLETQQTLVSGEFRDSLKRIEDDVKELKLDLKTGRSKPNP